MTATCRKYLPLLICAVALACIWVDPAFAQMPWEDAGNRIIDNLSGPTGWIMVILGIIVAVIKFFGGDHDAARYAVLVVVAGTVILNVDRVATWLF